MSQKSKYTGVSQNIQQQARGPHSIQHRGPAQVQVSRPDDYRQLQHSYSLRGSGGAVSGPGVGPVGAHDMSKTLGSQGGPPVTLASIYASAVAGGSQMGGPQGTPLAPPPASQSGAAPPGVVQGQHLQGSLSGTIPYYTARQGQPPQVAPQQPGQQPPQVQGGGQAGPQGGGPQRQVSGGRPPVQGGLGPMGLAGSSPQGPAYSTAQLLNYPGQQATYQPQHIPQHIIMSNCPVPIQAYQSQRSQFGTAQPLYYQPYVQHPQAMFYAAAPQMQMTMSSGGAPPAAQPPRGQHTPPAGPPVLPARQRKILEIVNPDTGKNIFDEADHASPGAPVDQSRSTPPTDTHPSGGNDVAGMFAAQVAAAAASTTQPPHKMMPPAAPPVELAAALHTPHEPPRVVAEVPPPREAVDESSPVEVAATPEEVAEEVPVPVEAAVPEVLPDEVDAPAEAEDTVVDNSVDRTPVGVGVEEKSEDKERLNSEPAETAVVVEAPAAASAPTVPSQPPPTPAVVVMPAAEPAKETLEGRETKKSSKKKKMKEWNKKGESKEGGDMDAFVDKEESAQQHRITPVQTSRSPTPPTVATDAVPVEVADQEDEEHRRQVVMKNEENIRVSREAALKEEAAHVNSETVADEVVPETDAPAAIENDDSQEEPVEDEASDKEAGDFPEVKQTTLKYEYREDQWSPVNPEGRKMYDRSFLLRLQGEPMSLQKPYGLPNLDVIKDTVTQHKLPDVQRYPFQAMQGQPGVGQGRNHPEHLFMPSYARNGVARPPMGSGGGVGRRQSQPGRGGEKPKKVITLSSSLNQEVKLHAAEKAWKPTHKVALDSTTEDVGAEDLYRKVRGILNKLTPQKFQSLVEQVRNLEINSEERLNRVIDLVFEKALDEPNFSVPYANMCKQLAMFEVPMKNGGENQMVNFRKLLLLKCQREFEKDTNDEIKERQKQIEEATTDEDKARLTAELAEDEKKFKRRSLGNIRFIGELYNLNMLTAPIMYDCLRRLLNSKDEDSLECLCKLLITIGKELDNHSAKAGQAAQATMQSGKSGPPSLRAQLDEYFRTMESIVKKREVSLRVVFMLQDVIDLRLRKWVPRRDENIPKTIDQIHEEAQREQVHEKLMRDSMPPPRREERGDRRKNRGGGAYDDGSGWNTVPSKKHVDVNKLKQINTKPTEMDSIQLGPASRMSSWAKGSSGGSKAVNQESENRPAANRFSALADTPAYDSRRSAQRSTASSRESSRGRGSSGGPGATTPSGVRKVPSQSRERDSALAAVKHMASLNAAPDSGSEPPAASAVQPPASRGDVSLAVKDAELALKGSANMDDEMLRTRTEALVDQFLCNSDFQDAVQNVTELAAPSNVAFVISTAISHVLERASEARSLVGQLLKELVRRKVVSMELFTKGLHEVLQYGEDMEIDIPKVWEYVAELLVPLFQDNWLPLNYLVEASEVCKANGRAGRMVACVLSLLTKKMGEANVTNLWRTSGLQWSNFLAPNEDVDAFVKANNVAWTLTSGGPVTSTRMVDVESQLNFLIVAKKAKAPEIMLWIESNLDESFRQKPQFIRALVSVIAQNAIVTPRGGAAVLNPDILKSYFAVLQKYLDNKEEHELQALYGLQALMNRLEHPKGVLVALFDTFYDCELISDDAFTQWQQSEDPAEQEGKGVALKSATSFFTWLGEMEGDSGDDN
ncbi:eukaryotic translation initiation factor 4 gamma 3-like isoform X2 [Ornithodoros turicata]|uniref:eukaryotic translation initiation factor 4 gamma 3-like isoform X2 n=1 Tax=Ornithodoros turicata TaxID=34597 RepID=UPI0031392F01